MGTTGLEICTESGQLDIPLNICCVVLEYLPGGTLKSFLIKNRRKKLPFKVFMQLALDLARGYVDLKTLRIMCYLLTRYVYFVLGKEISVTMTF